ncbi:MAG: hypothetical protein DMF89_23930 [Acidobacteria bacterium]|nr:MAG: hypothetical protein DMF89_23930 [Acidobacteriota bacterium]
MWTWLCSPDPPLGRWRLPRPRAGTCGPDLGELRCRQPRLHLRLVGLVAGERNWRGVPSPRRGRPRRTARRLQRPGAREAASLLQRHARSRGRPRTQHARQGAAGGSGHHQEQPFALVARARHHSVLHAQHALKEQRFRAIIKRLEGVPALLEQAKANLVDAPEVWNRVARDENDGNVDLVDHTLRAEVPDTLKADFAVAADPALAALRSFNAYLKDTLSRKTSDWRLGREKYALKFQQVLGIGKTPEQLLAEAEAGMVAVRSEMDKLAAPKTVRQALDEIAKHHATPATYMDAAKKSLAEAISFVREKGLVALPTRGNLQVIETPVFMRGVYAVGGFNPAPPLEPHLGAFYWVTPVPPGWPPDRVESKLREYNDYGLQELTIHEAMPGHYVQLEYANDIQPDTRRLLRNIFGNGPYVEGWGFYAQQLMSDEGYLNNSRELRLSYLKQALRALANTILDVRLQTMGMTDQEALDLMINSGFQEKEEATAKLQRAQLSSCQLPTYFAGWRGWLDVREHDKQKRGSAFSLRDFHDRALKEGAVPMPVLDGLLH